MKILLITPSSQQVIGFRAKLIETLQNNGADVAVLTFDDEHKAIIEAKHIEFHCVSDKNRSLNPFKVLSLKNKYCKVIKEVKPDVVFTFMVKPNTFGVLAAKKAGVKKIFSMVEGGTGELHREEEQRKEAESAAETTAVSTENTEESANTAEVTIAETTELPEPASEESVEAKLETATETVTETETATEAASPAPATPDHEEASE